MKQRDDLKGLADWDSHRQAWQPVRGKEDEVAQKLGPTWTFDSYFGAFFGQDPPEPAAAEPVAYPECGCYMCQGGSSCGGHMCSVETVLQPVVYVAKGAGLEHVECIPVSWPKQVRLVESKALPVDPKQVLGFDGLLDLGFGDLD